MEGATELFEEMPVYFIKTQRCKMLDLLSGLCDDECSLPPIEGLTEIQYVI